MFPTIRSYIGVPVVLANGTLYGTLCAIDPAPHVLTDPQCSFLGVLARLLATQIECAQERAERRAAEQRLAVQNTILDIFTHNESLAAATPAILHTLCTTLGWDVGALWVVDTNTRTILSTAFWQDPAVPWSNALPIHHNQPFYDTAGLAGQVWATATPVWIADVPADPHCVEREFGACPEVQSACGFPVFHEGVIVGLVLFASRRARTADPVVFDIVQAVSAQIGHFMHQVHVQEALRASETRFGIMVRDLHIGVMVQGPQAEIRFANPAALRLLGLTEDQVLGKTSFDPQWHVIHEDGAPFPGPEHPVPQVLRTGHPVHDCVMGVYRPRSGDRVWLLVSALPAYTATGTVDYVICTFTDMTAARQADVDLRAKQHFIENITTTTPDLLYLYACATRTITYRNRDVLAGLGYTAEESAALGAAGRLQLIHPEDRSRFLAHFDAGWFSANNAEIAEVEYRVRHKDGSWRWHFARTRVFDRYPNGSPHTLLRVAQDVTSRKEAETKLQTYARRQQAIVAVITAVNAAVALPSALAAALTALLRELGSPSGMIYQYAPNAQTLHLLAYTGASIPVPPQSIRVADLPETHDALVAHEPIFLATATRTHGVYHPHGGTIIVPLVAEGPILGAAYIHFPDPMVQPTPDDLVFASVLASQCALALEKARLTDRAQTERDRLATLVDIAPIGITVWDKEGQVVLMNPEAVAHTAEYPRQDATDPPPFTTEYANGQPLVRDHTPLQRVLRGETVDPELFRVRYADGRIQEFISTARRTPDGQSVIGISHDVTTVQQAARAFSRAQAEIALLKEADALKSRFIAVVSHELRTPLTGIRGFAELLTIRDLLPDQVKIYAGKIAVSAVRLQNLLDDYLDIQRLEAGAEVFTFGAVALAPLVQEVADATPPEHVIVLTLGAVAQVWGDAAKLRRVLENLVSNAIKYSPPGAPITVALAQKGRVVEVRVADQGWGIPADAQPHIFEKFYRARTGTAVQAKSGTGLGLAISRGIIERHGGQIGFESTEGVGTTFWFRVGTLTATPDVTRDPVREESERGEHHAF